MTSGRVAFVAAIIARVGVEATGPLAQAPALSTSARRSWNRGTEESPVTREGIKEVL